jgi:cleavage and polyadenylation specificity factor subunit 3
MLVTKKHIMSEPEEITSASGQPLPLNMSVDYISFSAHSDFLQTSEFIDTLQPPYVVCISIFTSADLNKVLVHGDANEMGRLKQSLVQKYENKNIEVFSPKNGQPVHLQFHAEKLAKVFLHMDLS